ncbi:MAG TPA: ABC transporter ATP-binding protein [Pseudobdellovibrionaceae bacterium]|nr:ABC transporter ATP-binding protein [Pseudobdellovibrionaceae bacterium]
MSENSPVLLKAQGLRKVYAQGEGQLEILKGIDLEIREGEAVGIIGASGAGKSTLLQIIGALDQPTEGELWFEGRGLLQMNDEELSRFRNEKMGFVFQFHHLLSELTALENVMLPGRIAGETLGPLKNRSEELLSLLGLSARQEHYPTQMSGGELQRVAIARALIRRPRILFADEPTGNLDSANSLKIQDLFFELKKNLGLTLVVVTHDREFASRFPRVLEMSDGRWKQTGFGYTRF